MFELSPVLSAFFSEPLWLALIVSLALIPIFKLPAQKYGLVDHPGGRKQHKTAASLVGGPAIVIAFFSTVFFFNLSNEYNGMLCAVLALFTIGIIDDKKDVSAVLRLFLQTIIITLALWYDNVWLGPIALTENLSIPVGLFTYPATVLVILVLQNSINMLDGIDGLSSGVILIILVFMIGINTVASHPGMLLISSALFGSVLGFWAFNFRFKWRERANVFMGDSGTMILGFMLPYMVMKLSIYGEGISSPTVLLWLLAIPVWDIVTVVYKRIKARRSPLKPGRDHIHHTLMNAGLSVRQVLHLVYLLCLCTASFGMVLSYLRFTPLEQYIFYCIMLVVYIQRVCGLDRLNKGEVVNAVNPKEKLQKIVSIKKKTGN